MKHLILCREYPPAPGGGIGAYVWHISRLLAESGESVHVIAQAWEGAQGLLEEHLAGRLVIHRLALEDWKAIFRPKLHPSLRGTAGAALFKTGFYPQAFAWLASDLAERLIEQEGIDLVEAQEYEAPLYYLLLRRALGLGPRRQPPCVVHLHSPTELIARYNEWPADSVWVQTAKELEDFCITAADALLCPSHALARHAETQFGLPDGSVQVIPLPLGDSVYIQRAPEVWRSGVVSYVGRLELRKGVVEWLRAACAVAREYPRVRFEFVGANILGKNRVSSALVLHGLVPVDLKDRFVFWGAQDRPFLHKLLSRSQVAAVPSRWENFPYTCIEAMCSGLPVIATRQGGLVEMIKDGCSGWLAPNPGEQGLADALRASLEAKADVLSEMGRRASADIQLLCDNQTVLARQLEFRREVAGGAAQRSTHLPPSPALPERGIQHNGKSSLAIVLNAVENAQHMRASLQSIAAQAEKPALIAVEYVHGMRRREDIQALVEDYPEDLPIVTLEDIRIADLPEAALKTCRAQLPDLLGLIFIEGGQQLAEGAVTACGAVFRHASQVGMAAFWVQSSARKDDIQLTQARAFPPQDNDSAIYFPGAYRTEALEDFLAGDIDSRQANPDQDSTRDLASNGWLAVTIPQVLVLGQAGNKSRHIQPGHRSRELTWYDRGEMGLMLRHPIFTFRVILSVFFQVARKVYDRGAG